jgi:hypothetical protein
LVEKQTDGSVKTVSKGATVNPTGNGGKTTFGKRAIPDDLCEKYTAKLGAEAAADYCDGEVIFAITTGAGQSNHYLGDVIGSKAVCDVSTRTRSFTPRQGFFINQSDTQVDGTC